MGYTLGVMIGNIAAACPGCARNKFIAPTKQEQLKSMDVLACASCGLMFTYVLLLEQITLKSISDSQAAIKASKKSRHAEE